MRKLVYANRLSGFRIGRTARSEMERSEIELPRNGSQETVSGAKGRTARSDALNTWRGHFEPGVKVRRADGAKRNRTAAERKPGNRKRCESADSGRKVTVFR